MRVIGNGIPLADAPTVRPACIAALLVLAIGGCSSLPRSPGGQPGPRPDQPSEATQVSKAANGRFAISAGRLDTWNAVGQIVVRLDGVTYEGRSQMLGLYDVRYRGEQFLIVTRARVMRSAADGMVTEVGALRQDGTRNSSDAAVELLGLLQQRLPAELARIAAGER